MMQFKPRSIGLYTVLFLSLALGGCLGGDNGEVTVYVKDQPTDDFQSIFVNITDVSVHQGAAADENDDGWIVLVDTTQEVDLLSYRDEDARAFLGDEELEEGRYSMIRLTVAEAHGIESDGSEVDIEVTSGTLRVTRSFNVTADETTRIVLDFDLDRPGVLTQQGGQGGQGGGGWRMTPVIGQVLVEEEVDDDRQDVADST